MLTEEPAKIAGKQEAAHIQSTVDLRHNGFMTPRMYSRGIVTDGISIRGLMIL